MALSGIYDEYLEKLCEYFTIKLNQLKNWLKKVKQHFVSLNDLLFYLGYWTDLHKDPLREVKQVFLHFYIWSMRKRFPIHVVTSTYIEYKEEYLSISNYLLFMPELNAKGMQKATKLSRKMRDI